MLPIVLVGFDVTGASDGNKRTFLDVLGGYFRPLAPYRNLNGSGNVLTAFPGVR